MNIGKTCVIAAREYFAAVVSKSFLLSLVLMPIFMSGGILAQKLGNKIGDTSTYRVAVMDCSPGGVMYPTLSAAVTDHNEHQILDDSGRQVHAKFELETVPAVDFKNADALDRQQLALSDRVRSGELLAFVEIGADVLNPQEAADVSDAASVRYFTNRPTYSDFYQLLQSKLPPAVIRKRFSLASADFQGIAPMLTAPPVFNQVSPN